MVVGEKKRCGMKISFRKPFGMNRSFWRVNKEKKAEGVDWTLTVQFQPKLLIVKHPFDWIASIYWSEALPDTTYDFLRMLRGLNPQPCGYKPNALLSTDEPRLLDRDLSNTHVFQTMFYVTISLMSGLRTVAPWQGDLTGIFWSEALPDTFIDYFCGCPGPCGFKPNALSTEPRLLLRFFRRCWRRKVNWMGMVGRSRDTYVFEDKLKACIPGNLTCCKPYSKKAGYHFNER